MKVLPILTNFQKKLPVSNEKSTSQNGVTNNLPTNENKGVYFAYRDFNISFTGRTPEDFYAQDFNRNNMPRTMRDFLDNDYVNNQHIPPEQMMAEVFKYLEPSEEFPKVDFAKVKAIYPKEDLFKNLHPVTINSRKGILSEIKVARDLSDTPLLKDGSDDFGMYLLKKIYLEGKTLKEISKDFLEKDINDEYKGFITEPVQYSTLDAYGIKYPNRSFWHSFIHTRDEYKKFFVTLPKNTTLPGVNAPSRSHSSSSGSSIQSEVAEKPHKRKFKLKSHRKNEIERDLINKKSPDMETVKKTVVKRFGKNDPEASFIVKYMSPIMTVAADRAHMSEEIKAFSENEQLNGKSSNGRTLFERFWKENPKMLEVFSAAVTDTIDMFEDIYGVGGMIPINSNLEKITPKTENQKIIDFVNPEFLELLTYTQSIEPERAKRYELHDDLQKQWEQHFIERYGNPEEKVIETEIEDEIVEVPEVNELSFEDCLQQEAEKNNASVFKLMAMDGSTVYLTANLDEVLDDEIKNITRYLPVKYARKFRDNIPKNELSDKFKLTIVANKSGQKFADSQLMPAKEYRKEYLKLLSYYYDNYIDERIARFAMIDSILAEAGPKSISPNSYCAAVFEINESMTDATEHAVLEFKKLLKNCKKSIDNKYEYYSKPLTSSEANRIENKIVDLLLKYDASKSMLTDESYKELITMTKEAIKDPIKREMFKVYLAQIIEENTYSKALIVKNQPPEFIQAKFDIFMDDFMHVLILSMDKMPAIASIFTSDIYTKHKTNISPEICVAFDRAICRMSYQEQLAFFTNNRLETL